MNYFMRILNNIENNKLFMGLSILLLNLLSKYIELKLTKTQEQFIKNSISREILIFIMCFVATKNIVTSLILTGIFMILANYVFNENSKYCIIKDKLNKIKLEVDINNDNIISDTELNNALDILRRSKIQKQNQYNF
jgi:uncharacterized membrane protein (DUF485 family)